MTIKTFAVSDEVRAVLQRSAITTDTLTLPQQLDRKLYEQTAKAITAAGGRWHRVRKCHVFERDPREALGLTIATGLAVNEQQTFQTFYTPRDLADEMVGLAYLLDGQRVLEPSAGTGRLLEAIARTGMRVDVTAVEIQPRLFEELDRSLSDIAQCGDFLTMEWMPSDRFGFDRIVMNPPFTNGSDIKHIKHALRQLNPGGRLVALCCNGPRQQAELKPLADQWIDLGQGKFKSEGTNIATAICIFNNRDQFMTTATTKTKTAKPQASKNGGFEITNGTAVFGPYNTRASAARGAKRKGPGYTVRPAQAATAVADADVKALSTKKAAKPAKAPKVAKERTGKIVVQGAYLALIRDGGAALPIVRANKPGAVNKLLARAKVYGVTVTNTDAARKLEADKKAKEAKK